MKSIQNWPGTSGSAGGGPSRISRSSKPFASSVPGERLLQHEHDAVAARRAGHCPIPTQLFVGPKALSGKKTIVRGSVTVPSVSG